MAMEVTNMLNNKSGAIAQQFQQHHFMGQPTAFHSSHIALIKPEPSMERSVSPHMSEHSSYSAHSIARSYNSPNMMHASMQMPSTMAGQMTMTGFADMSAAMGHVHNMSMHQEPHQNQLQAQPTKSFPCTTCGKSFARRSDLARHERIHSGLRPHVCDVCNKQFIQRSALTVHKRVHTGEKPHHCETCAKPFSDSSSLARHRRTHTGNRPYKCPYADCQKTFTRRTTLTRHQNHHSGTIEEAAVATAAALAATKGRKNGATRSDGGQVSPDGSSMGTPSTTHREMSMSPNMDLASTGSVRSHSHGDFSYIHQNGSLPPHLRVGSPNSTASGGYTTAPVRPTSHPNAYGPPPTLEPNVESHHVAGSGSATGASPHMSTVGSVGSVGWHSPAHVASPNPGAPGYLYPEPDSYHHQSNAAMGHMYYGHGPPQTQMRRAQASDTGLVHMA